MSNIINRVLEWNDKAGLLDKGSDIKREDAFIIEEALEGYDLSKLSALLSPYEPTLKPKEMSRKIIAIATWDSTPNMSKVDEADKAIDAIVYALGRLGKLGLDSKTIEEAINIVMDANMAKLGCPTDEVGKLLKPEEFEKLFAPEPKLKELFKRKGIE